jgi:membrane fusion protein, multidrug efflux system
MPERYQETGLERLGATARRGLPSGAARFFTKRMIVMLISVFVVLILVFGFIIGKGLIVANFMKNMVQTTTVATTQAKSTVWQTELRPAVGTLHAVEGADLASEVAGIVTRIGFAAGQDVRKGMLLVQLRDDTEKAAADEALQTYKRAAALIKTNAISRSDYDSALANMKSTQAAVEKRAIRAPFDGRAGIRTVDAGQYVAAGTALVTLQQLDPIYVDFQAPQQQLPLLKVGSKVRLTTDVFAGKTFTGEVVAFDPKVSEATRTVHVRALLGNPGKVLLPGMFATVIVDAGQPRKILTLPQTAITFNTYGDTVFVVTKTTVDGKEQLVAQQRFVTTGDTRGDQIAILSGITARDAVVSAGSHKLKNGTVVTVNNRVNLPDDANPHPSEDKE